ncbi:MAG: hypothetical protein OXU77_21360 [Gammaproteobacteria bacterium]|nr:hypothetical protein [Gammaproteobacteria bacterium]
MKDRHKNWVRRRALCSVDACFDVVHKQLAEDVELLNAVLGTENALSITSDGSKGFKIEAGPQNVLNPKSSHFGIKHDRVVLASVWLGTGNRAADGFTIVPEWSHEEGRTRLMVTDGDTTMHDLEPPENPPEAVEYTASRISMRLLEPLAF